MNVSIAWRKSSRSANESNCVEVALDDTLARLRDSKNPDGDRLVLSRVAFANLIAALKSADLHLR